MEREEEGMVGEGDLGNHLRRWIRVGLSGLELDWECRRGGGVIRVLI